MSCSFVLLCAELPRFDPERDLHESSESHHPPPWICITHLDAFATEVDLRM